MVWCRLEKQDRIRSRRAFSATPKGLSAVGSHWRDQILHPIEIPSLATPKEVPGGKLEEELIYKVDSLCKNLTYERSQHRNIGRDTHGETQVQRSQMT